LVRILKHCILEFQLDNFDLGKIVSTATNYFWGQCYQHLQTFLQSFLVHKDYISVDYPVICNFNYEIMESRKLWVKDDVGNIGPWFTFHGKGVN
jgi:hypothetical protein